VPSNEANTDPLAEIEALTLELANIETQLMSQKISPQEYESKTKQIQERIANAESIAYSMAKTNETIGRKLRAKNYALPEVQQVCNHFVYGSKQALQPEFGADRVPKYFVEGSAGTPLDTAVLERMTDISILKSALFEKILFCPKCSTPSNVFARFKCTNCASIDISINRMIEHLPCGTIHNEKAFRVGTGLVCPTCKRSLQKPEEQRLIGLVCTCNKCSAHFEDPVQSFFCRKCQTDFSLTTGLIYDVRIYDMNEKVIEEVRSQLGVPVIAKTLETSGFRLEVPGILTGKRRNVQFSIVARRQSSTLAIDLASSDTEVPVEPVLEFYVKILEANPTSAIFAAIPRLSQQAREVAATNRILVAEGATSDLVARNILTLHNEGVMPQGTAR
jgi:transposase-like protein